MDLFSTAPKPPLAEKLRPTSLDDVVGQSHLVGPGKPLRLAFDARQLHSFILWGPPGVGKTTLARLTAQAMDCEFIDISAVMAGVKEIREAATRAQNLLDYRQRRTVLFVDEIHRLNKGQQDALLPYVESGLFYLVGATTANPAFEVAAALLSRAQVYVLQPLNKDDLRQLFDKRLVPELGGLTFQETALSTLIELADGDARRFINLIEQLRTAAVASNLTEVTDAFIRSTAGDAVRRFDKGGDVFYEQISALHKSIRGSSPNAALYWLARMLDGGADPRYVARRLIRMASEEVGNADPRALQVAIHAADAYERLGSPEGELALAQAAVFLAVAPKSNAVYVAWNQARAFVKVDGSREVPMHLRNAPMELMKRLGYKEGYRYAHDEPHAYAAGESYFPDDLPNQDWYQPVPRGLEISIGKRLEELRSLDEEALRTGKARRSTEGSAPPDGRDVRSMWKCLAAT